MGFSTQGRSWMELGAKATDRIADKTRATVTVKVLQPLSYLSPIHHSFMLDVLKRMLQEIPLNGVKVSIHVHITTYPSPDRITTPYHIIPCRTGINTLTLKVTVYVAFIERSAELAKALTAVYADIKWQLHQVVSSSTDTISENYDIYVIERNRYIARVYQEALFRFGVYDGNVIKVGESSCEQRDWDRQRVRIVFSQRDSEVSYESVSAALGNETVDLLCQHIWQETKIIRLLGVQRDLVVRLKLDKSKTKRGYCTWLKCGPCFIDIYIVNPETGKMNISDLEIAKMVITHEIGHTIHFSLDEGSSMNTKTVDSFEVYADAYTIWRNKLYRKTLEVIRKPDHLDKVDVVAKAIAARFDNCLQKLHIDFVRQ